MGVGARIEAAVLHEQHLDALFSSLSLSARCFAPLHCEC